MANIDPSTVEGFGAEWATFDFVGRPASELDAAFAEYFSIFPWAELPPGAAGFDAGCGSGRWAARVAPLVGKLHCIDASAEALRVAAKNLASSSGVSLHHATIDAMPLPDGTMDFGYSLGVLHHLPDPESGLRSCVAALKPGAPFLLYLYYALDGRSRLYRTAWKASDAVRRRVAKLPFRARLLASQALAVSVYWPLAKVSRFINALGMDSSRIPLSYYKDRTFYVMRNDALDRFGTRLEHRFSREQMGSMMERSGLERVSFREGPPYWCGLGYRKPLA